MNHFPQPAPRVIVRVSHGTPGTALTVPTNPVAMVTAINYMLN